MDDERRRQILQLYRAVLAQETTGRAATFLAGACGADAELRAALESLLAHQDSPEHFLEVPALEIAAQALSGSEAALTTPIEGRRLGAYRILHEIGRGGMGSVYLADRVDEAFHKRVAIKIVRPGLVDAQTIERFRQEREILAALDHPTIARIIDGGNTDEAVPYFVMDYVDGQPIDTWCDRHKAKVTQRLELFRAVCSGVQHAHDHLVLHRDLKPTNIFVTAEAGVKLLDFGIAKLLASDAVAGTSANTATATRVMTPAYASPEQVRGEPLSVTSDVYSLGVVLYELLTGHWPYRTHSRLHHEIARAICEEEPTVPSTVVGQVEDSLGEIGTTHPLTPETVSELRDGTPAQLRRRLEGDLDKILLKALDKDPARRYRSVEQFSEDVRLHLEGVPVAAREATYRYRAGTFIRRHPVGVVTAFLAMMALQVIGTTTVWEVRVKVPGPLTAGAVEVRPELLLMTYVALALLVAAVYFSRAHIMRFGSALVGSAVFSLLVVALPIAMRWRRFVVLKHSTQALMLYYTIYVLVGAIVALTGWRIARRFGWRGLAGFVAVVSIVGPIREQLYFTAARLMVVAPGRAPWIATSVTWACALLLSHAVMRLMAGPAQDDRLARSRSGTST
jgi:eukaryotic-like serine/threonine-protein kinase